VNNQESCLDLSRRNRIGMLEAIWGENKTSKQISEILKTIHLSGDIALVTRVSQEKAIEVQELVQDIFYHPLARCITLGEAPCINTELEEIIILTGGTSDISVAAEADISLRWHGIKTRIICDIGVAGLHRLLDNLDTIKKAKVIIACAGMEGALPTVLAGLVSQPVIGLPVSTGYGVGLEGKAALAGMLSSCSPGLVVVNIDNGYGAAMAALRIIGLTKKN